jgi:hypothetical protein
MAVTESSVNMYTCVESNILLGLHGENLHVASAYGKIEEVA